MALARVRLSPLDPVLEDLYTDWSEQLMRDGAYEQAAKWYGVNTDTLTLTVIHFRAILKHPKCFQGVCLTCPT